MKKSSYLYLFFVSLLLVVGCGDNDDDSAQLGKWLASSVERSECNNEFLNGTVNCINDVGSGNSESCVELTLSTNGYLLAATFDSNQTDETGDYQSSSGNIRLCPTNPTKACYDVPIITSDFESMTIDLPRENNCIARVSMIKTSL